jgi:hypothetical protein
LICAQEKTREYALVLLKLDKLTEKAKYRKGAKELAEEFKSEFVCTAGNRPLWHYSPSEFYAGWSEKQDLSKNTPARGATKHNLFEVLSHAGLNLKFLLAYHEYFPGEVFNSDDIERLSNTIYGFVRNGQSSRFVIGDTI